MLWYPWLNLCPDEKFQVRWLWESETQYEMLRLKSKGQADPSNQSGGKDLPQDMLYVFPVNLDDILIPLVF